MVHIYPCASAITTQFLGSAVLSARRIAALSTTLNDCEARQAEVLWIRDQGTTRDKEVAIGASYRSWLEDRVRRELERPRLVLCYLEEDDEDNDTDEDVEEDEEDGSGGTRSCNGDRFGAVISRP